MSKKFEAILSNSGAVFLNQSQSDNYSNVDEKQLENEIIDSSMPDEIF